MVGIRWGLSSKEKEVIRWAEALAPLNSVWERREPFESLLAEWGNGLTVALAKRVWEC